MRSGIYDLLTQDSGLENLGVDSSRVIVNYSADQRPVKTGPFIVIRWGTQDYNDQQSRNEFRHFDIWVHWPQIESSDYDRIDSIIDCIDGIFSRANDDDIVTADGYRLGYIEPEGRSGDLRDDGYETFCRSASFKATSSKVT